MTAQTAPSTFLNTFRIQPAALRPGLAEGKEPR